ncbi:MAG TPA: hypothetical protein VEK08_14430 [Planctomycetota bacterium]|nr:hypothetical protein [Planctomycetota bacterium]
MKQLERPETLHHVDLRTHSATTRYVYFQGEKSAYSVSKSVCTMDFERDTGFVQNGRSAVHASAEFIFSQYVKRRDSK